MCRHPYLVERVDGLRDAIVEQLKLLNINLDRFHFHSPLSRLSLACYELIGICEGSPRSLSVTRIVSTPSSRRALTRSTGTGVGNRNERMKVPNCTSEPSILWVCDHRGCRCPLIEITCCSTRICS